MTLQELLTLRGLDLNAVKLARHNMSNPDVRANYERGHFNIYLAIQSPGLFAVGEYVLNFIGMSGTEGTYVGGYEVQGIEELNRNKLPSDYSCEAEIEPGSVYYVLRKTDILEDMINRLVIEWGKGARTWRQKGTTEKEVLYILPHVSTDITFQSYDKVILTYRELCKIVENRKNYKIWEERLSSVAGVYLITDTSTGKHYVGSASGEDGGIWGRWSNYAKSKHGGNVQLKKLMEIDENHCRYFQYSILDIFPIKRDKHEILAQEQLYKRKLWSITFGMNDN